MLENKNPIHFIYIYFISILCFFFFIILYLKGKRTNDSYVCDNALMFRVCLPIARSFRISSVTSAITCCYKSHRQIKFRRDSLTNINFIEFRQEKRWWRRGHVFSPASYCIHTCIFHSLIDRYIHSPLCDTIKLCPSLTLSSWLPCRYMFFFFFYIYAGNRHVSRYPIIHPIL